MPRTFSPGTAVLLSLLALVETVVMPALGIRPGFLISAILPICFVYLAFVTSAMQREIADVQDQLATLRLSEQRS